MKIKQKILLTALHITLIQLCYGETLDKTKQVNDTSEGSRGILKRFTNLNVSDTLTANTLNVSNGGNITGGLTVLGNLVANGAAITAGAVGPQGPAGVSQYAFVSSTGTQTINDNAPVIFTYTTASPSSAGITIPATGQSTFTVAEAGTYMIIYFAIASSGAAALTKFQIKIVGGAVISNSRFGTGLNTDIPFTGFTVATLTAGQQFQLVNASGGAVICPAIDGATINAAALVLKLA